MLLLAHKSTLFPRKQLSDRSKLQFFSQFQQPKSSKFKNNIFFYLSGVYTIHLYPLFSAEIPLLYENDGAMDASPKFWNRPIKFFFEAENQNSVSNKTFLFLGSNYSQGFVKIALKL